MIAKHADSFVGLTECHEGPCFQGLLRACDDDSGLHTDVVNKTHVALKVVHSGPVDSGFTMAESHLQVRC